MQRSQPDRSPARSLSPSPRTHKESSSRLLERSIRRHSSPRSPPRRRRDDGYGRDRRYRSPVSHEGRESLGNADSRRKDPERTTKRRTRDYEEDNYGSHDDASSARRESKRRRRDRHSNRKRETRRKQRSADSFDGDGSQKKQEPAPAVAPNAGVAPAPAGIVSDDEDHHTASHNASPVASSRNTARARSPGRRRGDGRRNKNNQSPSSHDDTVGHFQGGPGTVIADRYRLVREVGLGTFGRVVECLDLSNHNHRGGQRRGGPPHHVAIKIVRSVKRYCQSAMIEADIVRQINRRGGRGIANCVVMHDAFTYFGHFCLVFENLGPSLYDFMKRHDYRPFPMICIQDFAVQLLDTMEFLHSFGLIHTDLKIENILLTSGRELTYRHQRVPESTRIKLIDFGGACYDNSKKSSVINTRQYRAPEVILEAGWSMPSDMWSLGCILAELYRGELMFPTHENVEHLALIERALGPFPWRVLKKATKLVDDAFDSEGRHRLGRVLSKESLAFVRNSPSLQSIVRNPDDAWFLRLLSDILQIDPEERSTAHECLKYLASIRRDIVRCA